MVLTIEEIDNLENAILTATRQTSLIMLIAMSAEKQGQLGVITPKEVLEANMVYAMAMQSIDKLRGAVNGENDK